MGSLRPQGLATILFSDVFGSLRATYDYWGPDFQSMAEGTWTDRATNYPFAGTIPALLLLWHGIAGGRLLAREFRFFLLLGVAVVLFSLRGSTPGVALLFHHPPRIPPFPPPPPPTLPLTLPPSPSPPGPRP